MMQKVRAATWRRRLCGSADNSRRALPQKVNVIHRRLQTSFVDSGKRDLAITANTWPQNGKIDFLQMPIEPCRLRMERIAERGYRELMVTSVWRINCNIGEKEDKCLAVNAGSKGMHKCAQTRTIKNQWFCDLELFWFLPDSYIFFEVFLIEI